MYFLDDKKYALQVQIYIEALGRMQYSTVET